MGNELLPVLVFRNVILVLALPFQSFVDGLLADAFLVLLESDLALFAHYKAFH